MKHFIFLLLWVPFFATAQELKLHITDATTQEDLPFANLYLKAAGIGASSNMEGMAQLPMSKLLPVDTLVISYIGYETRRIALIRKELKSPLRIGLNPTANTLGTVVVSASKPPKPLKIIRNAIKNTSQNYHTEDVIINSLYRETIREHDQYVQLNDALVKTYYTRYPQKKLDKKIWINWVRDESQAFNLEGDRYVYPLLKDFNTAADQQVIVASRKSGNHSIYDIETTIIGDPLLLFALDKIKYQYDFMNPQLFKKYRYKLEEPEIVNGEYCHVISFYPKEQSRRFRIDQSRKNKHAIYIGRMYITEESFALVRFRYKLAVARDFGFFEKAVPLDYEIEMNFSKRDDRYSIDYIRQTELKRVGTHKKDEYVNQTSTRELQVLSIETEHVKPLPDSALFKSTQFSSLRGLPQKYDPGAWQSIKIPDHLSLSTAIRKDLSSGQSLEEQFEYAGKPEKKAMKAPVARKAHFAFSYHNEKVVDSLHWMAQPASVDQFKSHLRAENKYAKNFLIEDKKYQQKLFEDLRTFYPQTEDSSRLIKPGSYFEKTDSLDNNTIYYQLEKDKSIKALELTRFREENRGAFIRQFLPNHDQSLIAVKYQLSGVIGDFVKILTFGENQVTDSISGVYSLQWLDETNIVYSKSDSKGRAGLLFVHNTKSGDESVIYQEEDPTFDIEIIKSNNHFLMTVQSKTENEIYELKSIDGQPKLSLIRLRKTGVVHKVVVDDKFYVLVNDEQSGSRLEYSSLEEPQVVLHQTPSAKGDFIDDIAVLQNRIVALIYNKAFPKLKYLNKGEKKWKSIKAKLGPGEYQLLASPDTANAVDFSFNSARIPFSHFRYDFAKQKLLTLDRTRLKSADYTNYNVIKQEWATSADGVKVPMTIIQSKIGNKSNKGVILFAYGAYGAMTIPGFSAMNALLLHQGYTLVYTHVRGESVLGTSWYRQGRTLNKKKSVDDYLASAQHLIKTGITRPEYLVGYGNSAGGVVVAAAANRQPGLFKSIILDHAYLDVVNTMMDASLPLTIDEYKEWGNPQDKGVYDYIKTYSPYQNIKKQVYPHVLLIGSFYDYQTPIWQIAKYQSKLRAYNQGDSEIILLTDMSGGHIGNTNGTEWIKLFAETYSFVNTTLGINTSQQKPRAK
ncbi:MAG: hypothetical protein Roseis2KO_25130 [Roseivirga sp.]